MIPASILLIILVLATVISNVALWMQFSYFKSTVIDDIRNRLSKVEQGKS